MSEPVILPVKDRRQKRDFLLLPWKLYRGDPHWVPPLLTLQKDLVGYGRHPFYDHATSQTFLAYHNGQPCGRVAAIVNHAHNQWHQEARGFFGFFESINDPAVARGLLDAAWGWLLDQGMTTMRGPTNPSINYEWGLLVEGFDRPPMFMMTYNPPYYGELIEQAGFTKAQDLYAFWGHVGMIGSLSEKHRIIDEGIRERFGVVLREMDRRRFRTEVAMFLDMYNKALSGTWGFVPLSRGEVQQLAAELRHLIVPELSLVAEVDGKPIGMLFGLLDYNQPIRQMNGRLFPFGFLKLLSGRKKIKHLRILSTNVLPEFQSWGIGISLARGLLAPIQRFGIEEVEFSWVLESNNLSRKTLEKGGAQRYKTYRVYDRVGG